MSTTDEAIALARRIVDSVDPNSKRITPHPDCIAGIGGSLVLSRALLAATSPGAQYRAGMESACNIAEGHPCDEDGFFMILRIVAAIRAAIAALPAPTTEEQHG